MVKNLVQVTLSGMETGDCSLLNVFNIYLELVRNPVTMAVPAGETLEKGQRLGASVVLEDQVQFAAPTTKFSMACTPVPGDRMSPSGLHNAHTHKVLKHTNKTNLRNLLQTKKDTHTSLSRKPDFMFDK